MNPLKPLRVLFFSITFLIVFSSFQMDDKTDFKEKWKIVNEYESKGLPKSALEIVNEIYQLAQNEENNAQIIKAVIYKLKYKEEIQDDALVELIYDIEVHIENNTFPATNLLHFIKGNIYWQYYQRNRWTILENDFIENQKLEDITNWSLEHFVKKVIHEYDKALTDSDKLKEIPIKDLNEILIKGNADHLRPTLFDFIIYDIIEFYSNQDISLTNAADQFKISDNKFFLPAEDFTNIEIETKDEYSLHFHAVKLYQQLLSMRLNQEYKDALLHADIQRINFIYQNAFLNNKDSLYIKALTDLASKNGTNPLVSNIYFSLAEYYYSKANLFEANVEELKKYRGCFNIANEYIAKAKKEFPKAEGTKACINLENKILKPDLTFECEQVYLPQKSFPIKIAFKNLDYCSVHIYKRNVPELSSNQRTNNEAFIQSVIKNFEKVDAYQINIPEFKDHQQHSFEKIISGLEKGYYVFLLTNDSLLSTKNDIVAFQDVIISDISYLQRSNNDGSTDFFVLNRKKGEALEGAIINTYVSEYDHRKRKTTYTFVKTDTTDASGQFTISYNDDIRNKRLNAEIIYNDDTLLTLNPVYVYPDLKDEKVQQKTLFFTDRAIYRPGQIVYFKGIMFEGNNNDFEVIKNEATKITVNTYNQQKITELKLKTNEFGSFHGSFVLPKGNMNGQIRIKNESGSKTIRMEEYKRPKFYIEFDKIKDQIALNQEIKIKGKAISYAESSIQNAQVKFHVTRKAPILPWFYRYKSADVEINQGEVQSNNKGEFEISFNAIPDHNISKNENIIYYYNLHVEVTDINGETQSEDKLLKIGYNGFDILTNAPQVIETKKFKSITINFKNSDDQNVKTNGNIQIHKLEIPEKSYLKKYWDLCDTSLYNKEEYQQALPEFEFSNETSFEKLPINKTIIKKTLEDGETELQLKKSLKPGIYKIEIQAQDAFDNAISKVQYLNIYDENSKNLAYPHFAWFNVDKLKGIPGEEIKCILGSSENIRVIFEIEKGKDIIESSILELENEQKTITIPIKESYRGNFNIHFTAITNNRVFEKSFQIKVPFDNKRLHSEITSFRDKIEPGSTEKWTIKIKDFENNPAASELLLSMYDKSLDDFVNHTWKFNIFREDYLRKNFTTPYFNSQTARHFSNLHTKYIPLKQSRFDRFNWFGFHLSYGRNNPLRSSRALTKGDEMMALQGVAEINDTVKYGSLSESEEQFVEFEESKKSDLKSFNIRSNFNETAFFYPGLRTDSAGNILVEYTTPDALTTWKVQGLTHTQDLSYELFEKELITQKKLMVFPNLPRFVRENDTIILSTKIVNLSDTNLIGKSFIQVSNAFNDEVIIHPEASTKDFTCELNGSIQVDWEIVIPSGIQVLNIQIFAESEGHKDGEAHIIPVMPSKILVTETLPISIRPSKTKAYRIENLINSEKSKTLEHFSFTLEYTANPIWYAIQALTYIHDNERENAKYIFSRLYFNMLAKHILNQNPEIERIVKIWQESGSESQFLSNLEKNQELKTTVLETTPWLMDALDETDNKKRIAQLFDNNFLSFDIKLNLEKLKELQNADGSWSWYKGMRANRYITQHIVAGFGQIKKLQAIDTDHEPEIQEMIFKAIDYLDFAILNDYERLKKIKDVDLEKDHLSNFQIHYLYMRSFYNYINIPEEVEEAYQYYTLQSEKYWVKKGKYQQGQIALKALRNNNSPLTKKIVTSLKEYSIKSEELGIYWKENYESPYWYDEPIAMHALMIELFNELEEFEFVNELQIWLLKQKQTNHWPTTKSTVNAVYALLLNKPELIEEPNINITIGNNLFELAKEKTDPGIGYLKKQFERNNIEPSFGNIKVVSNQESISWGAIYWQYYENIDRIKGNKSDLEIEKKIFKKIIEENGEVLVPIEESELNIGDKIVVQLEITTNRDLEFVHLKDMRATGFEPAFVNSGYKYDNGIGYYFSTKDVSQNFFFDNLPKGNYFFQYEEYVNMKGNYNAGIATIQCMYAPEFSSNSKSYIISIN